MWSYLRMLTKMWVKELVHHPEWLQHPHRNFLTIIDWYSNPYTISASTHTFLNSLQITLTIIRTMVQHIYWPINGTLCIYVVVPKCRQKASISAFNCYLKTPHLPKQRLTRFLIPYASVILYWFSYSTLSSDIVIILMPLGRLLSPRHDMYTAQSYKWLWVGLWSSLLLLIL